VYGLDPLILDLTRPQFGTKVYRFVCPGLEVEPSVIVGGPLAAATAETGGGAVLNGEIAPM
jgi:hypothetical protein